MKRPVRKYKRSGVNAVIDEPVKMHLEMLGFHIPKLIEELLNSIAEHKRCPCCGREVKPVITGRKISNEINFDL